MDTQSDYYNEEYAWPDEEWSLQNDTITNHLVPYPEIFSPWIAGLLIAIFVITGLIGDVANSWVLRVLCRRQLPSDKFDLRTYIIVLAILDLVMGSVTVPITFLEQLYGRFIDSPAACSSLRAAQMFCLTLSVYILVAIGLER